MCVQSMERNVSILEMYYEFQKMSISGIQGGLNNASFSLFSIYNFIRINCRKDIVNSDLHLKNEPQAPKQYKGFLSMESSFTLKKA